MVDGLHNKSGVFSKVGVGLNSYYFITQHSIENDTAIDIVKQMSKARTSKSNELLQKYVDIMKKHDCDDMFTDILSKSRASSFRMSLCIRGNKLLYGVISN